MDIKRLNKLIKLTEDLDLDVSQIQDIIQDMCSEDATEYTEKDTLRLPIGENDYTALGLFGFDKYILTYMDYENYLNDVINLFIECMPKLAWGISIDNTKLFRSILDNQSIMYELLDIINKVLDLDIDGFDVVEINDDYVIIQE